MGGIAAGLSVVGTVASVIGGRKAAKAQASAITQSSAMEAAAARAMGAHSASAARTMAGYASAAAVQQGQALQFQSEAEARAAEFNASVADINVRLSREAAADEATMLAKGARKTLAQMRVDYAASGVRLEGTPMDVITASTFEAELDVQRRLHIGELEATGFMNEAKLERMRASAARTGGRLAIEGARLQAQAARVGGELDAQAAEIEAQYGVMAAGVRSNAAAATLSASKWNTASTLLTGLGTAYALRR